MLIHAVHTAALRAPTENFQPVGKEQRRSPETGASLSSFLANAEIFAQGEPAGRIYRLESGVVRICRLLSDGRRQISAFHFPGDVFGLEADEEHRFSAEAVTPVRVASFRIANVVPLHGTSDGLAGTLWRIALRSLSEAQEHLLLLGRQNALERLASFMVQMAKRQESLRTVDLPMSRADIADYLGLTLETVSRMLAQLKQHGLIRLRSARHVELLNLAALEEMSL